MSDHQIGDPVEPTRASEAWERIAGEKLVGTWQKCPNCGRMFPAVYSTTGQLTPPEPPKYCGPCGISIALAQIEKK